jgi:hypothetical protein
VTGLRVVSMKSSLLMGLLESFLSTKKVTLLQREVTRLSASYQEIFFILLK